MKKNILITGASGFVGVFLIKYLLKNKNNVISALYYKSDISYTLKGFGRKVNWIKKDLVNDNLDDVLENIDIVYHLAGYSSMGSSLKEKNLLNNINVIATERLANTCKLFSIKHFIFVSSVAACEFSENLVINEKNGFAVTPYGKSKKKAEESLLNIAKGIFNVTILRPTALFGEYHKGSVYEMIKKIQEKRFVKFGVKPSISNFFYIKDFVKLLDDVSYNKNTYNKVFIASDTPQDLNLLTDLIIRCLNIKHKVLKLPIWFGYALAIIFQFISLFTNKTLIFSLRRFKAMINRTSFSNIKISKAIDLKFDYGVNAGLIRTINWYKEKGML